MIFLSSFKVDFDLVIVDQLEMDKSNVKCEKNTKNINN